jgi:circadian clock protein KaiC
LKLRGAAYREGVHDFVIRRGGVVPFPRLVAVEHEGRFQPETVSSGIPELDRLLGGGLETGTTTLITGPAGAGKSILSARFAMSAVERGHKCAFFVFDEERHTLLGTTTGLGIPLAEAIERGTATLRAINPAELSPGEFVHLVRQAVETDGATFVVIDSLNGYLAAMPEENLLGSHLREIFSYLRQRGTLTIVTMALHGIIGTMQTNFDVSYLADSVVLLRFYEQEAALRRAISVIKRRGHEHDSSVRELRIAKGKIESVPMAGLHGVLTGIPRILPVEGSG